MPGSSPVRRTRPALRPALAFAAAGAVGALLGVAVVASSAGAVGPLGTIGLGCGDTVTVDETLFNDIGPCSGGGLTIGVPDVTLDLNGHRIFGDGSGNGHGISSNGHDNVVVTSGSGRGTVDSFNEGVFFELGSGNTVERLKVRDNFGSQSTGGGGIILDRVTNSKIRRNLVSRNGPFAGIGIFGAASTGNRVRNNVLSNNLKADGPIVPYGIVLGMDVFLNVVRENTVDRSGFTGIGVDGPRNRVISNIVKASGLRDPNGSGIYLDEGADMGRTAGNDVQTSALYGIGLTDGASNNRIVGNTSMSNGSFDLFDGNTSCDANFWRFNTHATSSPACAGN